MCRPQPGLGEEVEEVGEVCLAGGRVDNGLDRDAEERQCEDEDEEPEDEFQKREDGHGWVHYTTRTGRW